VQVLISYSLDKSGNNYYFNIDAIKLNDPEAKPYEIMFKILINNLEDNIVMVLNSIAQGIKPGIHIDDLVLANSLSPVKVPEDAYNKFMLNEYMINKEQKECSYYMNQPIELKIRKVFNTLDEYMTTSEHVLNLHDTNWQNYKFALQEKYEKADEMYNKLFKVDKNKLYNKLLDKQIKKINYYKNNSTDKEMN
jgi:hypothetical protein